MSTLWQRGLSITTKIENSVSKSLLIIGPGFVGKEIVRIAKEKGYTVHAASRSGGDGVVAADLSKLASLGALESKLRPDCVIHCAASGRSADRLASYRSVYLEGCKNVCAAFPNAKKIFTSSSSVYAQTDGSTVSEESETAPSTETAKILLQAEQVMLEHGGTVARLSGIYGKGRSYMLKRLFAGEAAIEAEGSRLLNHIHHIDAAKACLFLLDQAPGIYNVSDSSCLSQKATYERLCSIFDLPMPAVIGEGDVVPSKRGYSDKCVSNKKLIDLGWKPDYPSFTDAAVEIAESVRTL